MAKNKKRLEQCENNIQNVQSQIIYAKHAQNPSLHDKQSLMSPFDAMMSEMSVNRAKSSLHFKESKNFKSQKTSATGSSLPLITTF